MAVSQIKKEDSMEFDCLKDETKCLKDACSLFMRPNDCAIKSLAISVERIAVALEEIVSIKNKA